MKHLKKLQLFEAIRGVPCPLGREEEWGRRCGARGFGLGGKSLVVNLGSLVAKQCTIVYHFRYELTASGSYRDSLCGSLSVVYSQKITIELRIFQQQAKILIDTRQKIPAMFLSRRPVTYQTTPQESKK